MSKTGQAYVYLGTKIRPALTKQKITHRPFILAMVYLCFKEISLKTGGFGYRK